MSDFGNPKEAVGLEVTPRSHYAKRRVRAADSSSAAKSVHAIVLLHNNPT